jgi:two-component system, OmpR family, sensor histidine kinase BaeS
MKFGVTSKLFLAFLLTNVAIALVVAVAAQVAVKTGFRSYVNEREERRLLSLSDTLVDAYRAHGDWEFLRGNDSLWRSFNRPGPPGPDRFALDGRPPPPIAHGNGRPPPPPANERRGPPPGEGPPRPHSVPPTATLLDAQRHLIAGKDVSPDTAPLRPIIVDGATVGWIATTYPGEPFDRTDLRFQDEQLRASWIIAAVAVLLAAVVAILLARRLLVPIKRLASATHRLAQGDYSTRVSTDTQDEVGQLVADFNHLAVTLEKNEGLRRQFMAEISHELRTPLAVLGGEIEALEDGIRAPTPASLKSLRAEVATLAKLIDDLYDLSLADVGALTYRLVKLDVSELLDDAVQAFKERYAERNIALDFEGPEAPVHVDGDATRLIQLFNNLLENSLRYTDPPGRLRIALQGDENAVHIDFQDSAPAVPESLLPRLFERLFRVESSRSRERGGAGLGLALCQTIVEAHAGRIAAKPSPLGGLWIEIVLPAA